MNINYLTVVVFSLISTITYAQVEIDKPLEMTGTYPNNNITGVGTIDVEVGYKFNGSVGTAGQLLRSNGSTGFVPATLSPGDIPAGSGHYIHNQTGTNQAAGFRISGNAIFNNSQIQIDHSNWNNALRVWRRSATDDIQLRWESGNVNLMLWKPDGNVHVQTGDFYVESGNIGIGTSSPVSTLAVEGDATFGVTHSSRRGVLYVGDDSDTRPNAIMIQGSSVTNGIAGIGFSNHSGTAFAAQAIVGQRKGSWGMGDLLFLLRNDGDARDVELSDEKMRITSAGNIGIGTTNPSAKLHVNGSIRFQTLTNGYLKADGSGNLSTMSSIPAADISGLDESKWSQSGSNLFPDNLGWRVGIGTSSPGERLEVNGNIWLDGQLLGGVGRINMGATNLVISANNNNDLRLSADNLIRIESGENAWAAFSDNERLGLGTTSPESSLHIMESSASNMHVDQRNDFLIESNRGVVQITHTNTANAGSVLMLSDASANTNRHWGIHHRAQGQNNRLDIQFGNSTSSGFNYNAILSPVMSFTTNGNVGIGTTSPGRELEVAGNVRIDGGVGVSSTGVLEIRQSGNGVSNGIALTSSHATAHRIWKNAGGVFNIGTAGAPSMLSITTGGNIGIGTASPAFPLDVNGNARIHTTAGTDIIFDQSGIDPTVRPSNDAFGLSGTSTHSWWRVYSRGFVNTSDMRLKTDIHNSNYGLNEVMQMRPVSYKWRERPKSGEKIGFIAQELLDILPEVVAVPDNPEDENLGVSYTEIIPVLVNAIQEQQKGFEKQQELINKLKAEIEHLKEN